MEQTASLFQLVSAIAGVPIKISRLCWVLCVGQAAGQITNFSARGMAKGSFGKP